jgi:peptidoglycan L-alanyl-D-glutamate endopeptidase CwlK
MATLGVRSKEVLATCHADIQAVVNEAIREIDFTVVCGRRGREEQEKAVAGGKSKLHYPASKHNVEPPGLALAVDLAPYRDGAIQWNDIQAFIFLAGIIKGIALTKGIKIRWGGDFNRNNNTHDDRFMDMPHFELEV